MKIIAVEINEFTYRLGEHGIIEIREHIPTGDFEGDKWYYDVVFDTGRIERLFKYDEVTYEKED